MADYYDWQETLSYDADVTMVIGARGCGKTYGLRKQFIKDYIKRKWRFVELCRYKNELSLVADGYFNRLARDKDFEDYEFKTDARFAYMKEKDAKNWEIFGYFIAMTDAQKQKKRTFDNVRRILLDEAVLETNNVYHRYLKNEYMVLANIVDTVSRERADTEGIKPRVYLLGNACDITNPYFAIMGIGTDLQYGYKWFRDKTFLLHYVDPKEYAQEKLEGTVAGRMVKGTSEELTAISNTFLNTNDDFVLKKPKRAKFMFGIISNSRKYGVWVDYTEGYYHITDNFPNNAEPIYSLTRQDSTVNYINANRLNRAMKSLGEAYWLGIFRYDSALIRERFANDVLKWFGVK